MDLGLIEGPPSTKGLRKCRGKREAGKSLLISEDAGGIIHGTICPPSSLLSPFIVIHKDPLETKNTLFFPEHVPKVSFCS